MITSRTTPSTEADTSDASVARQGVLVIVGLLSPRSACLVEYRIQRPNASVAPHHRICSCYVLFWPIGIDFIERRFEQTRWRWAEWNRSTQPTLPHSKEGGASMANLMIEDSGIRFGGERRAAAAAPANQSVRAATSRCPAMFFDDGWETLEDLPTPFKTEVQDRAPAHHQYIWNVSRRNTSPDISFDRSINGLSWLRAWLHLLLRAADPRLYGHVAGARLRGQAVCQAGRAQTLGLFGARVGQARATCPAPSPYRHQHRSLSADREDLAHYAPDPRGPRGDDHPVGIVTKSALVTRRRSISCRAHWRRRRLVKVALSVTTLDKKPGAFDGAPAPSTPPRRLQAMRALHDAVASSRIGHGGAGAISGSQRPRDGAYP